MQHHPLPGRIRLRFTQLKNKLPQLAGLIEALRDVAGIVSVEASPFTGGILIHYKPIFGETAAENIAGHAALRRRSRQCSAVGAMAAYGPDGDQLDRSLGARRQQRGCEQYGD